MSVAVSYVDARGTSEGPLTSSSTATVTNVNDAPTITSNGGDPVALINVDENQTLVTQIAATDVDSVSLTYQIVGGADAGLFNLDAFTGVLSFTIPPRFSAPSDADGNNYYEVTIQISDGNGGFVQQQIIAVVTGDPTSHLATDHTFIQSPNTVLAALDEQTELEGSVDLLGAPAAEPMLPDFFVSKTQADLPGPQGDRPGSAPSEGNGNVESFPRFDDIPLLGEFDLTQFGPALVPALNPVFQIRLDLSDLNQEKLWRSMSEASAGLLKQDQFLGMEVRSLTIGSSVALSAGVVAWALRGGALATALMASVPTLSFFNPMLIVIARRSIDGDQDVVGDMFSRRPANSMQGMSA
nr:cadherin repeat domain-containing protein [Rhizobium sp. AQ_MP]